ncbi:hypothetical protein AAFM46_10600 [Arthrobacter sp. TMP15]|uniref:hypothetical protein n=1 Tax=Arthrobacter sp. TMP15 TaxID=3140789 RepID=UPI0031BB6849
MEHFLPPPWLAKSDPFDDEHGATRLSRLSTRGEVIRVRRGFYLPEEVWKSLKPWHRYRTLIQAVNDSSQSAPVFSRESAASILGLPTLQRTHDVHCVLPTACAGGRSENGVRRHNPVPGDPEPWRIDGLLTTSLVETARDLAASGTFAQGLAAMDRLMNPQAYPAVPVEYARCIRNVEVEESLARLISGSQQRKTRRALNFADSRSGSAGESWSRAIMIQHGFHPPVLQKRFSDARGTIGDPDFLWEEFKTMGEFDGHEKYSAQRFLKGRTPAQIVIEEKNRENRLRALGYNVLRWEWADLENPQKLITLLRSAGLPQCLTGAIPGPHP